MWRDLTLSALQRSRSALVDDEARVCRRMWAAVASGDHMGIRNLISHGASVDSADENGMTALHLACKYQQLNCVKVLLENRASLVVENRVGQTPLTISVLHCNLMIVRLLLHAGADPHGGVRDRGMPLYHAIRNDLDQVAIILITAGAWLDDETLCRAVNRSSDIDKWKCLFSASIPWE
eukprot:TRINITY_DN4467_c0_g1_i3.p1 TRINITY_DN4467_c0_g1~~TRINITY_DN4467_c0_g1_i3.p1  ORF type:complete len:179 (+),score=40.30 TRINITY_DN4467_c0_g1_i3:219-755(+)